MSFTDELFKQWKKGCLRRRKNSNLSLLLSSGFYTFFFPVIITSLINIACSSSKHSISKNPQKCSEEATIVDYTGLDGCSKMLVLDNDKIILPTEAPPGFLDSHYGQRVSISYKEQESMVSICMAEDISAKITCLEIIDENDLNWLDMHTSKLKPRGIYRCSDEEGAFIYLIAAKESNLYNLDGDRICATPGKAMSDCVRRFNASKKCRIWGLP
ncbi:MAG: hypothetical protein KJP00_16700 [Bacteroidia bacterium]|nr:hypothetical protein [Bacteroidia bacterium]